MQSLCGSLNFVAKARPGGRAFCRRFYNATIGIRKSHFMIKVTNSIRTDAKIWIQFLENYNNKTPFPDLVWSSKDALNLYTDSCGSCGGGAFYDNHWTLIKWPNFWSSEVLRDITFLELVPLVAAIWLWQDNLAAKKLTIDTDNMALVHILNSQTSKSQRIMSLLRPLVLVCIKSNIQIKSIHIPGHFNSMADSISRFQWERFRTLAPNADSYPSQIPSEFWNILDPK